jgi:hypothetical protein
MKKSYLRQIIKEELVKELFDTKKTIKWIDNELIDYLYNYSATFIGPNKRKYEIELQSLWFLDVPSGALQLMKKNLSDNMFDAFTTIGHHIEFGDEEVGKDVTGFGGADASKIFGIVINATIEKAKQEKLSCLFFSAKEPSRKALYKKIAPMIASRLGMKQFNNGTYFFLYNESEAVSRYEKYHEDEKNYMKQFTRKD